MDKSINRPIYPIHVGSIIKEELLELGMTVEQLAERTGQPLATMQAIVDEQAPMTEEVAAGMYAWLGVKAQFWMNLQRSYEADIALEQSTKT